jgi:hypothetical protein
MMVLLAMKPHGESNPGSGILLDREGHPHGCYSSKALHSNKSHVCITLWASSGRTKAWARSALHMPGGYGRHACGRVRQRGPDRDCVGSADTGARSY